MIRRSLQQRKQPFLEEKAQRWSQHQTGRRALRKEKSRKTESGYRSGDEKCEEATSFRNKKGIWYASHQWSILWPTYLSGERQSETKYVKSGYCLKTKLCFTHNYLYTSYMRFDSLAINAASVNISNTNSSGTQQDYYFQRLTCLRVL